MVTKEPTARRKHAWRSLAAVCVLVIGGYAYMAQSGMLELLGHNAADSDYNLLVQGFRAGHLSLKRELPTGFAQLANPYDPDANASYRLVPYRLHDMSYYKGRLYIYFGVTPALILFWPFVALTCHYLFHRQAVAIFCAVGFLASVGLLYALWRRYFADVSAGVVAACALALGLTTGVPVLLSQADIYQVPISCGYMLIMLVLVAIWCALHETEQRGRWLAVASVAYGLAVGARPSLLLGAVILLVPVAQAWRERRSVWVLLVAAMGPIMIIGLGLLLYNALRFNNPFEFGMRYQLTGAPTVAHQSFSLHYLWFNFRVYFLEPARWSRPFPYVLDAAVPPLPPGHSSVERPFGVLTNIPFVWLALAVPLIWRRKSEQMDSTLRWFVAAVVLLFGMCGLTLGLFCGADFRYEVDFLPTLLLLAVIGILGLEHTLAPTSESGLALRPLWRRAVRWVWGLLLVFSVVFNLLAGVQYHAEAHYIQGFNLLEAGNAAGAAEQYQQAVRLSPNYLKAHFYLGVALEQTGRIEEAIGQYEQVLRLDPDYIKAHFYLGAALERMGRVQEAIEHYQLALRLKPDNAEAHNNLGAILAQVSRVQEAIGHFEEAVRIQPDYAEAQYNLAAAFEQTGKTQDAIGCYEQALRGRPDLAEARTALARLQADK
jgi:tetratricopeptide (TPR) repeat protein